MAMASNNNSSYETSWADQWDYSNPDPVPVYDQDQTNKKSGAKAKYTKKVEEGFGKTKAVASGGMKRVKSGAHVGLHWIKDKYHKTTGKTTTN